MTRPDRLLAATGNPGKLAEIRELLAPARVEVVSPAEAGWNEDVVEDGGTLEANALKKARAAVAATGLVAVADDTGLFVEALGGEPGVRSARYAGEAQDPAANCAKLLAALAGVSPAGRGAAFRCVVALVAPMAGGMEEHLFEGSVQGRITGRKRGASGFGYDPLFEPLGAGRTFAEMQSAEKHGLSHRGRALGSLRAYLAGLPGKGEA